MQIKVYRFRAYNVVIDEMIASTRLATAVKIQQIRAQVIPDTEREIDPALLADGWTEKNFL